MGDRRQRPHTDQQQAPVGAAATRWWWHQLVQAPVGAAPVGAGTRWCGRHPLVQAGDCREGLPGDEEHAPPAGVYRCHVSSYNLMPEGALISTGPCATAQNLRTSSTMLRSTAGTLTAITPFGNMSWITSWCIMWMERCFSKVFLLGNSEGGMVAAKYHHPCMDAKLTGRIIAAYACGFIYFTSCAENAKVCETSAANPSRI